MFPPEHSPAGEIPRESSQSKEPPRPNAFLPALLREPRVPLTDAPLFGGGMANQGTLSWPMARALATRSKAEAIVDGETRLTYLQWGRRVRGLPAGLRSLGLRTGDVIASIGQNSFRHLECWVGIPTAGMVLNDLNYRLAVPELGFIINDCGARAIVADGAYLEVARQLKQRCSSLKYLVY